MSVSVRRSGRRMSRKKERKKEGRKEGAEVASKNKNPTLRMWGKKTIKMSMFRNSSYQNGNCQK